MGINEWIKVRRLLWDDDEHILIVDDWRYTKPMKLAGKVTIQPKAQFCCGNSFRLGSSRRKDNVQQFHTWVIEFDEMPIEEQRQLWEQSDMPHTLRVFSGNKSLHVYIRCEENVDSETWLDIANNLKLIFPKADSKVLTNRCGLSRLPLGMRGKICQKVETTKSRITLQSLTEWIEKQDVIKHKGIKAYRDKDIEKNIIDDTTSNIGKQIRAMARAKEMFRESHPELHHIYNRLVADRFKAEKGKRNERLIETITFLHDSVCKEVAMQFVEHFYKANAMCFNDTLEQHMREAEEHWQRLDSDYPSRLTPREREYYTAITSREKTFFRICRSLAHSEDADMKLYIPMTRFGYRMGQDSKQVSRMIDTFKSYGLLKTISKGTQNKRNEDGSIEGGKSGTYQWLLDQ